MKYIKKKDDYVQFKTKILVQTLLMVVIAFLAIYCFYYFLWHGRIADMIVSILCNVFLLDYEAAISLYQQVFRNHFEFYFFGAILLSFFIMFRIFLSWFTKYLKDINQGIDALINQEKIVLAPELSAVEKKLVSVQQTLETRSLEAKLSEQRKNDLVMYLAHDIRTPLTSVIGYLSLLYEVPEMPAEQRAKYVHITLDKANRLEKLMNEFFEITRYNINQIPLEKESIDLNYMLMQLIDEFYPILSKNENLAVLHGEENLIVYGDSDKLARVFNNLLKNAVSYSYAGTKIDIIAVEQEGIISITFKNKGRTIPKERLEYLFEKFYRLDEARTSVTGGSGLGLSIAKEIITLHGGTITAFSEEETVCFTVSLPGKSEGAL